MASTKLSSSGACYLKQRGFRAVDCSVIADAKPQPNFIIIFVDDLGYADVVAEVDWSVGKVLNQLQALKIDEQTLVLFTSGNGGPYFLGRQAPDYSSNYPYSGGKVSAAEGGFRVPTIAWWPGTISAGTACDLMASTVDILPTFATLSGRPFVPEPDRPIDGYDLSSIFK